MVQLSQKCNKWWSIGLSPLFTILFRLSHEQTPLLSSFAIFSQPCFKISQGLSRDFTVESQLESDLLEQATFVGPNGADCSNVGRKIKERQAVTTTNRSLGGRNAKPIAPRSAVLFCQQCQLCPTTCRHDIKDGQGLPHCGVMGENCKASHHKRPLVFLSAATTCPGAGGSV